MFHYVRLALAAVAFSCLFTSVASSQPGPGGRPPQGISVYVPKGLLSKTIVKVKRWSGDVSDGEIFGMSMTISSPDKLTFYWQTNETNVASAIWQVSDKPFAPLDMAALQAQVLASGSLAFVPPAKGKAYWFTVDFAKFVSQSTPSHKKYYLRVVTVGALGQQLGLPSSPVTITYIKPMPDPSVKFNF